MCPFNPGNLQSFLIPTIETERLRLRAWRITDFDGYLAYKTNTELQRYVIGGAKTREQVWDDFCAISGQWVLRKVGLFLIADRKTDEPRGFTGLWYPLDQELPELSWSLFPGNTGKGYATEAATAARRWVYENRQYHQLVSYIHPDNVASCAVAERLGAKLKCRTKLYGEERLLFLHPIKSSIAYYSNTKKRRIKMADQKSHDNPLELKFSKTFEANPKMVFNALTHPDLIQKWFGPHGYTCPVVEVDLSVGGKYHIEMKPPEGEIIKLGGVYNLVDSPNALEYTWLWDEPDAKETTVKVGFIPTGTNTEVTVQQGEFASAESKEGHEQGWLASFERLKEVLQA